MAGHRRRRAQSADIAGTGAGGTSSPSQGCTGQAMLGNIYGGQPHELVIDFNCPKAFDLEVQFMTGLMAHLRLISK